MAPEVLTKSAAQPAWTDPHVLYEFPDGRKIVHLDHPSDLTKLGIIMVHCSGDQIGWVEDKLYYFFVLIDAKGRPLATVLGKDAKWMNKRHPNDGKGRQYLSTIYDQYVRQDDSTQENFEVVYRCPLPNRGNKPAGVDEAAWEEYVKAHKALSDNYKTNVGSVRIMGRRIKFDGKYLMILQVSGAHQGDYNDFRKLIGEWLNSLGKKET